MVVFGDFCEIDEETQVSHHLEWTSKAAVTAEDYSRQLFIFWPHNRGGEMIDCGHSTHPVEDVDQPLGLVNMPTTVRGGSYLHRERWGFLCYGLNER